MPLEIDIAANTTAAQRNVKTLGDNLEDVVDALDKVGDGGKDAGRDLERSLQNVDDQAKRTARSVDDVGRDGFGRAGAASGEFKQEALSNLSEVTSSFKGDMNSAVDLVQGTLGGLAGSLPGIGLAAGAAAVGVGAIGAAFNAADEAAAESAQRSSEWADKFIESGGRVLDESIILSGVQTILKNANGEMDQARAIQASTGGDLANILRALSGDSEAAAIVTDELAASSAAAAAASAEQERQTTSAAGAVIEAQDAANKANGIWNAYNKEIAAGATNANIYSEAMRQGKDDTVQFTNAVNGIPQVKTVDVELNLRNAQARLDAFLTNASGRSFSVRGDVRIPDWQ